MAVLIVTDEFVRRCPESPSLLSGVLYSVLQANSLRIGVDRDDGLVWARYEGVARSSAEVARWMSYLSKDPALTIEYVSLDAGAARSYSLFVALAVSCGEGCTLVVWGADECRAEAARARIDRTDRGDVLARIKPTTFTVRKKKGRTERGMTVNIENFFSGNSDFVIVNKSDVSGAVGKYAQTNPDLSKALADLSEFVERSNNLEAGELWSSFVKEAAKPEPSKTLLRTLWDGVVKILPEVAKLAVATSQVAGLFA